MRSLSRTGWQERQRCCCLLVRDPYLFYDWEKKTQRKLLSNITLTFYSWKKRSSWFNCQNVFITEQLLCYPKGIISVVWFLTLRLIFIFLSDRLHSHLNHKCNKPHFLSVNRVKHYAGCWGNTRKVYKPRGDFSYSPSFPRGLLAHKSIESVFCCLNYNHFIIIK